jgi:hypothetical protein
MRRFGLWWFAVAAALCLQAVPAARAEPAPTVNYGGILAKKPPKPQMPDVPAPPAAWPRLDTGAVVCQTQGDLQRHAAAMRGETAGPADCRLINHATAISIVARRGPGQTEVKFSGTDETAWTDAWLPAKPPPGSTAASNQ